MRCTKCEAQKERSALLATMNGPARFFAPKGHARPPPNGPKNSPPHTGTNMAIHHGHSFIANYRAPYHAQHVKHACAMAIINMAMLRRCLTGRFSGDIYGEVLSPCFVGMVLLAIAGVGAGGNVAVV